MRGVTELLALNRGRLSRYALARIDLKRAVMAAEEQTNFMPSELGPMMLRPGMGHLGSLASTTVRTIPFLFSTSDSAVLELTNVKMRVWVGDALLANGASTATVTNGTFDTNLTGWTDADESGAASAWVTDGYMGLTGTGANAAIRRQQVTVTNTGVVHRLLIDVTRGPVLFRIGSSAGDDDVFGEASLGSGSHNIAFTPSGDFHIQLSNRESRTMLVDSVTAVSASATVEVVTPWVTATLPLLNYRQSGDVIYVANANAGQQYKIERRSNGSWSVVRYEPLDGPFRIENVSPTTITASAISGSVTLTASADIFRSTNIGGLFRISSVGQTVQDAFTADNDFTGSIRVIGIEEARRFSVVITGTFTATLTLQRSFDDGATWEDVTTYTTATSTTYKDGLDNQIVYYRIGVKTGDYTSGTATARLYISSGSITGVVKITAFGSQFSVTANVLSDLGGTSATSVWAEGEWSNRRGWPTAVEIHDSRLFWAGADRFWGSVTDAYETFDPDYEGDAGPISRTIGFGPVDSVNWLLSLGRLVAGTDGAEITVRSTSFDEPLTNMNFTPKETGTQGSSSVQAVKVDGRGIFVQRCGTRVYEISFDVTQNDFVLDDLTRFIPEIGSPGIVRMAVQRQPDTRVHCVRSDGTVGMLLFNRAEQLICWVDVETDGLVKDVCVLPDDTEDAVYYAVVRENGAGTSTGRMERWAKMSEARGAAVTKLADGFVYASASSTTLTGLDHLEGLDVVLWGNGEVQGTAEVTSGSVTFPEACTNRCAGLEYEATFKSSKLAYVARPGGSGLGAPKRIDKVGLILADTHQDGIEYGADFTNMDPLPATLEFAQVAEGTIHADYDSDFVQFDGEWQTDARLCIRATAPYPCTVLAAVVEMEAN